MEIEKIKIDKLISPDYNPRDITPEKLESLKKSINEFGYIDPLIVNKHNNHIVGGNQRYEALKQLGVKEVFVSYVNIKDINKEKALNIRLNNSSGEWNEIKLQNILEELKVDNIDITLTGFEDIKIETYDEINFNDNSLFENENYDDIHEYANDNNFEDNNEIEYGDVDDLYSDEDNIQTNIRASNWEHDFNMNKKIFFTNNIDQDLFYKFIEKIKKEYKQDSITLNLLSYLDDTVENNLNNKPFASDFELIFTDSEQENRFKEYHVKLRKRYPKVKDPFIEYIKEFNHEL